MSAQGGEESLLRPFRAWPSTKRAKGFVKRGLDRLASPAGRGCELDAVPTHVVDDDVRRRRASRVTAFTDWYGRVRAGEGNKGSTTTLRCDAGPGSRPGIRPVAAWCRPDARLGDLVRALCLPTSVGITARSPNRALPTIKNDPGRLTTRVEVHAGSAGRWSARAERVWISRRAGCGSNRCSRPACRWSGGTGPGLPCRRTSTWR